MSFASLLKTNIAFRSLSIVTNLIITLLLTRLMSVEGYGILSLMVANASIFSLISCLGSESGITYHYASGSLKRSKIFFIVYIVIFSQIALLLLGEFIHQGITGSYWLVSGKELKFLFWGVIYLLSITLIDKYIAFLNGSHQYTLCNKIIFTGNLITLIFLCGLFFFDTIRPTLFYLQVFIAATFLQAILLILVFHTSTKNALQFVSPSKAELKLFFSYSFLAFVTNIIQFLAYRVDYWLVNYYKGNEALGHYSLAVKLGQMFWVLPILFASIIFPQAADKEKKYDETEFLILTRITTGFLFIVGIIAFALAGRIIPLFFGEAYRQTVTPFRYLLPGFFLFCINIMLAAWFAGKNQLHINFTGSIICFILVFALDLWLIPLQGVRGAAIASSIAYTVCTIYSVIRYKLSVKISFIKLFIPQHRDWKFITGIFLNQRTKK